ncbi:MAG: 3-isopropylmalate dehydratase large subunit [candidate division Zixibacteria bacterium]|nr:3-isopropylmalate dehydratase large subunit [candidate division Zixibacteria bacterium]
MGLTLTEKILASHCGKTTVVPGEILNISLDMVMANELSAILTFDILKQWGVEKVFDPEKVCLIPDHFTPNKDIHAAKISKIVREFANRHNIKHYYEQGRAGIEHAVIAEKGIVFPGETMIGGDSHTCTAGALGAFATGVGSTDIAAALLTGEVWIKVPPSIKIEYKGKPKDYVHGKDLIIYTLSALGTSFATYKSLEYYGETFKNLKISDRLSMANMAIETGGKNGIFAVDDITIDYLKQTDRYKNGETEINMLQPDEDAEYEQAFSFDISDIEPQVAYPHSPGNGHSVSEAKDIKIDQAVIGSCTNGWYEDMKLAASVFKGRKIHPDVRVVILPGSVAIQKKCIRDGLAEIFIDAGCIFSTSTCGPCIGGHMGVLGPDEVCVSTTNRNFLGRMGDSTSKVYLANPAIAAASAIAGKIAHPDKL